MKLAIIDTAPNPFLSADIPATEREVFHLDTKGTVLFSPEREDMDSVRRILCESIAVIDKLRDRGDLIRAK